MLKLWVLHLNRLKSGTILLEQYLQIVLFHPSSVRQSRFGSIVSAGGTDADKELVLLATRLVLPVFGV